MDFKIILFEGTDIVKFGMRREEVRAVLGKEPDIFRKSEFDSDMTENYLDICHVFYEGHVCAAFEFFSPSQVFFDNAPLLRRKRDHVERDFIGLEGYESRSDGFGVYQNDLSLYAPFGFIESVYISRKGYWESQYDFYAKAYDKKYKINDVTTVRDAESVAKRRILITEKMLDSVKDIPSFITVSANNKAQR